MATNDTGWLLLDTWDLRVREALDYGFSNCETLGERELIELPLCPSCKRRVWGRAIANAETINFTGKRIGDISDASPGTLVVSERFRDSWVEGGMMGIEFSNVELKCRFPASNSPPSKTFVFAYPQPLFTDFDNRHVAERETGPTCSFCASSPVRRVVDPRFASISPEQIDCFLPSCMPGWVVISTRVIKLAKAKELLNFSAMRGFAWTRNRVLERFDYALQLPDGKFEHYECFTVQLA